MCERLPKTTRFGFRSIGE